jgi:hypothetical protein
MLKILSAIATAALIAGAIVAFIGTSETVDAGTPEAAQTANRLVNEAGSTCINRGWPYFDHGCPHGEARPVRLVTTDRI